MQKLEITPALVAVLYIAWSANNTLALRDLRYSEYRYARYWYLVPGTHMPYIILWCAYVQYLVQE